MEKKRSGHHYQHSWPMQDGIAASISNLGRRQKKKFKIVVDDELAEGDQRAPLTRGL